MKDRRMEWLLPYRYAAPADMEKRLEALAEEGWHTERIRQWHSIAMPMRRAQPAHTRYAVELHSGPAGEYTALWESFGWTLAGRMASVYIWRMAYDPAGKRPEAFTDRESLVRRNAALRRTLGWLAVAAFVLLVVLMVFSFAGGSWATGGGRSGMLISLIVLLALIVLLLISRARIGRSG